MPVFKRDGMGWIIPLIFSLVITANATKAAELKLKVVNLEDGEEKSATIGPGDSPMLLCYPGPKFNVWRTWEDVTFEVNGSPYAPKVFGASEDDAHGLVDHLIKSYLVDGQESATDLLAKIEKRAIARVEYFPSLFDLLTECPPIWNQKATSCTKVFSPFGRSCISVSVPSNSKAQGKAEVKVKLTVAYREKLPLIMAMGFALMYISRYVSKSKILWYCSGVSISVLLGIVILTVFLCRKIRIPGAGSTGFAVLSALGYGAVWVSQVGAAIKAFAAANWELLAGYCAVFALLGAYFIRRIRRNEDSKHDFRILVLWCIRAVGAVLVLCATRSSLLGLALLGVCVVVYVLSRLFGGKEPKEVDSLREPGARSADPASKKRA